MEKEFIPYQEALALKELGFDEPCLGYFHPIHNNQLFLSAMFRSYYPNNAPTYSQAFRFFREKYKIDSWIEPGSEGIQIAYVSKSFPYKIHVGHYALYEEAELALLKSLIKIAK